MHIEAQLVLICIDNTLLYSNVLIILKYRFPRKLMKTELYRGRIIAGLNIREPTVYYTRTYTLFKNSIN